MQTLKPILKLTFYGAVLSGVTGMFVGAGPPLGMVHGLGWGALVGALLGIGVGVVRLFTFKPWEENLSFQKGITFWKLLSDNQRFACKVGLLVFGSEALLGVLGGVLFTNLSGGMSTGAAVASLFLGLLVLCVFSVLLALRWHSKRKAGGVNR